jgi:hypothetical protein
LASAEWSIVPEGNLSQCALEGNSLALSSLARWTENEWLLVCLQTWYPFHAPGISRVDTRLFRRELEATWRERVNRARVRYEEKMAIRRQMLAERPEWPMSLAPDPDGRFALNLALKEESAALTEYMRLLRIYTKLSLHGTPPEEDPGS